MPVLHLDTGNTGFMLLCSSLVMLMTPGLAFFYGGLVGRKNVLAIMMQSFAIMGWTTVLWWAFGFSMCFSGDLKSGTDFAGIIGNFHWAFLSGVSLVTPAPANDTIPLFVFFGYQMMFAIITPALITGAFANRVRFPAYMIFLTLWLVFVYFPFVHMIWGGGLMASWGVLDFAGGIVVHNIAGIAALASVLYVGRRQRDGQRAAFHSARRARHRPALVRLVRVQRGQRIARGLRDRRRVHQYRSRGELRGGHLARSSSGAPRASRSSSGCSPAPSRGSRRSRRRPATCRPRRP